MQNFRIESGKFAKMVRAVRNIEKRTPLLWGVTSNEQEENSDRYNQNLEYKKCYGIQRKI